MPHPLQPGFIALHSNRSENLVEAVAQWLANHPLGPLEEEVILVQSNAMAEWLKMELAARGGVCAATRVELPARFLWRTYRQVLGREAVPSDSPLDKIPMTWRIMQLLPGLLGVPVFGPVRAFLRADEPDRTLQLAARLADQFDQYQIYRARWLGAWAAGQDVLIRADGTSTPLPADQLWQPALWRAIMAALDPAHREFIRPQLEDHFLARVERRDALPPEVARRITVFGVSQFPLSSLRAVAALARHSQVLLAVFNPCRYFWADIIGGSELLRFERRRHASRASLDLSTIAAEEMHNHANPLLASWGRQSRDFVRQLDAFDDAEKARRDFDLPRIDLFDDDDGPHPSLLRQVQDCIRDLVPVDETRARHVALLPDDRSIVFQIAHSNIRELEILQDHLLGLLAHGGVDKGEEQGEPPLQPRDIVVMVPDIEQMAPAVRAVFGQYRRDDPRYIPFDISDLGAKSASPLIGATEWLLTLPQQRCRMSELVDLLEVPAIATRFGIDPDDFPRLTSWMVGAGIRWGLDAAHRARLGLDACGDQNSALFGLHRMLLGYCSGAPVQEGADASFDGIEPYAEVGGLDAALAGSLFHLLQALKDWWSEAIVDATPDTWAKRGRRLLESIAVPCDDTDRQAIQALTDALNTWRDACEQAKFADPIPLAVFRAAWLEALNLPSLGRRFRAGGVTFCSLMPLRVVPFEVVCLLGMNDGDYPRSSMRSDFDLMGLAGMAMPGDRSRRDDDRQLMLEALLSARRQLYVSWAGRSVRDNSEQPASVLVSQLSDYLAAGWGPEAVSARTTEHPLQPFSRQYFEPGSALVTYAREWRAAHDTQASADSSSPPPDSPAFEPDPANPLSIATLVRFLRNPVKAFFRTRLSVVFDEEEEEDADEESWSVAGLDRYGLVQELLEQAPPDAHPDQLHQYVTRSLRQIRLAGRLPISGMGEFALQQLDDTVSPMLTAWATLCARYPRACPRQTLRLEQAGAALEDWIDNLRYRDAIPGNQAAGVAGEATVWIQLQAVRLCDMKDGRIKELRADKMLGAWVRSLACAASGASVTGLIVDQDAVIEIRPVDAALAHTTLLELLALWVAGMSGPLPLPLKTSLKVAQGRDATETYEGGFDNDGEAQDMCLARVFPDFEALQHDGALARLAPQVHGRLLEWVKSSCSARLHGESA